MNELDYQLKVQKEVADKLNLKEKVKRLQEQLNEANEVIRFYKDPFLFKDKYNSPFNAIKYLEKWGVK